LDAFAQAGKGRTGTVICSYLLYCGEFDDPLKAIRFFGRKRYDGA
jgi:protein-tyrosine phosphatase